MHGEHRSHGIELLTKVKYDYEESLRRLGTGFKRVECVMAEHDLKFLDEKRKAYVRQINEFIGLAEDRLQHDYKAAEAVHLGAIHLQERQMEELRGEMRDMSGYFALALKEAKHIGKSQAWFEAIEEKLHVLETEVGEKASRLELGNHIAPPVSTFGLEMNAVDMPMAVYGQQFVCSWDGARLGIEMLAPFAGEFVVSFNDSCKLAQFVMGPNSGRIEYPLDASAPLSLKIRPLTFKDAFHAASLPCAVR